MRKENFENKYLLDHIQRGENYSDSEASTRIKYKEEENNSIFEKIVEDCDILFKPKWKESLNDSTEGIITKVENEKKNQTSISNPDSKIRAMLSNRKNKTKKDNFDLKEIRSMLKEWEDDLKFKSYYENYFLLLIKTRIYHFSEKIKNEILNLILKNIEIIKLKEMKIPNKMQKSTHFPKPKKIPFLCEGVFKKCARNKLEEFPYSKIHPDFSTLIQNYTNEVITVITNLINEFSDNTSCDFVFKSIQNGTNLVNDIYDNSIRFKYNEKIENKIKLLVEAHRTSLNLNSILKSQRSRLEVEEDQIKNLEEEVTQTKCMECNTHPRSVIFYPCLHFTCCEDCFKLNVNNIKEVILHCILCDTKVDSIRVLSL